MTPELLTDLESLQQASHSWFPPHLKTRPILCEAVTQPANVEEVAALVAWATENAKTLRAVGGGSGTGERVFADIAVDTSRLTALSWSEEDLTVTAGAGVTIATIEEQLTGHGYTLGQSLGSATLATVGGCIATDAHGLFTGRYGSFRECVLTQTVIGGVIITATLAMRPQPEARAWAVFDFGDFRDACDALRLIHRCDAKPALARIIAPQRIVLAFEGDELVQTGHFQLAYAVCQQLGGTPGDPDDGERWLESRQKHDFWSANAHPETFADFMRLRTPWSTLAETHQRLCSALEGRVTSFRLEVAHPSAHGAAIELTFTVQGDERRYQELRATLYP